MLQAQQYQEKLKVQILKNKVYCFILNEVSWQPPLSNYVSVLRFWCRTTAIIFSFLKITA